MLRGLLGVNNAQKTSALRNWLWLEKNYSTKEREERRWFEPSVRVFHSVLSEWKTALD